MDELHLTETLTLAKWTEGRSASENTPFRACHVDRLKNTSCGIPIDLEYKFVSAHDGSCHYSVFGATVAIFWSPLASRIPKTVAPVKSAIDCAASARSGSQSARATTKYCEYLSSVFRYLQLAWCLYQYWRRTIWSWRLSAVSQLVLKPQYILP
jgi:hypothetical protein